MKLRVRILDGQRAGEWHEFTESGGAIGRHPSCALYLPDTSVSARHAVVDWDGGRWTITDQNSTNGTFLGGPEHRLVQDPVSLGECGTLVIGTVRLEYSTTAESQAGQSMGPIRLGRGGHGGGDALEQLRLGQPARSLHEAQTLVRPGKTAPVTIVNPQPLFERAPATMVNALAPAPAPDRESAADELILLRQAHAMLMEQHAGLLLNLRGLHHFLGQVVRAPSRPGAEAEAQALGLITARLQGGLLAMEGELAALQGGPGLDERGQQALTRIQDEIGSLRALLAAHWPM